jgi:hypothetical protein
MIRIDVAFLDPDQDPCWECGSRSRSRRNEIDYGILISSFSKSFFTRW